MSTGKSATTLDLLLEKIYRDGQYDFRSYKSGTVTRRLGRRLNAVGAKNYLEYMQFLDTHPEEYQRLADDLAIKVSSFFRNSYTFAQIARLVLPPLVASKRTRKCQKLRFWSTACAYGEEPYSIAIMLSEFLCQNVGDFDIVVRASDISLPALAKAQAGVYTDTGGLSDNILKNYFTRYGESYTVSDSIQQMVTFSHFDLASTTGAPFTNLDCVFCCNVLIYMQKHLQERVLNMLYNSLADSGYLVLGEAETLTSKLRGKFQCLDFKARIFNKNAGITQEG